MKIIYMHHAERDNSNNAELKTLERTHEDITNRGEKIAEILSERIKDIDIKAIVTSPYLRCRHTSKIINKYHNVQIIEDERFNEINRDEEWRKLLKRNMQAIDDIVNKYNDEDTILCVTSGVNFSAFVCYFYNIEPTNDVPWSQVLDISPIIFNINKNKLN